MLVAYIYFCICFYPSMYILNILYIFIETISIYLNCILRMYFPSPLSIVCDFDGFNTIYLTMQQRFQHTFKKNILDRFFFFFTWVIFDMIGLGFKNCYCISRDIRKASWFAFILTVVFAFIFTYISLQ